MVSFRLRFSVTFQVTFFEAYFVNKISIKADMLDILEHRHNWASFRFTWETVKFIISHLLPEASFHTRDQDKGQVREHYDRGNDFYNAFLGPMMVYTSGIICDTERRETLEEMQLNKLDLVCNKLNLVEGEKMLDIGCGWGTLAVHAALKYGAKVTAVTLAKEQTEWGLRQAEEVFFHYLFSFQGFWRVNSRLLSFDRLVCRIR